MAQRISDAPRVALISGVLELGGAVTFLCNLAGELIRRDIASAVWSFEKKNPLAQDFERLRIPVSVQDETREIFEDRLVHILTELAAFNPSVVVANLSATSYEVLRYVPKPVFRVLVVHADHPGVYAGIQHYAPVVDLVACVSQKIAETVSAMQEFAKCKVRKLPLGVPIPGSATPRQFRNPLKILYLGRLDREQKRVHLFPEILDQLKSSGIPFHWTIAGTGTENDFLARNAMTANPLQTVSMPGPVPYERVTALLQEHDVFLLTSDYEGLPLSLLEAMGCGLVPVVSDLPSGIREVVASETGMLIKPENIHGYAEAIIWLHQHRDSMRVISEKARHRVVKDFSVGAMADRWLAIFPRSEVSQGNWPDYWKIKPMLVAPHPIYFSPPIRALRRLAVKFRS